MSFTTPLHFCLNGMVAASQYLGSKYKYGNYDTMSIGSVSRPDWISTHESLVANDIIIKATHM